MNADFDNIEFVMPKTQSSTIKVIGVGGGGSNAVNHMYKEQILGVDFVICNTDAQALENSPIPNKIQLGASLTSGLGAGANPEIGEKAAKESMQEIQQMLNTHTKMVFITAGMGGGTGTGAAPIIAKIAKDMDILTVGIVTMPFQFEGKMRSQQAQLGIAELRKNVDSLIVINNNKLREVYGNLGFKAGFSKADEVLSTAAKGIAEVITHHYKQNIDLHDAKTVLSNSGTAIMGSAKESGQNRAKNAIVKALDSPLLNDNKITGAKNVLLLIVSGANEVTIDEIGEINDYIQTEAGYDANIIMGIGEDENLNDAIAVTVVATGFAADQQNSITNAEDKKIIHSLEDEQKLIYEFNQKQGVEKMSNLLDESSLKETIVHTLNLDEEQDKNPSNQLVKTTDTICDIAVEYEEIQPNQLKEIEFIINEVKNEEVKVQDEVEEPTFEPCFEFPLNSSEEIKAAKKTSNIFDIEVFGAEEIVAEPVKQRYVLEDFDLKPTLPTSKVEKKVEQDEEIVFEFKTTKTQAQINEIETESEEVSPLSLTIAELQKRAEDRRQTMKGYNYKFNEQLNKNIDEIEKQPAYKRLGVDLEANAAISKSKTSIQTDANGIHLNTNNTFLHDNVD